MQPPPTSVLRWWNVWVSTVRNHLDASSKHSAISVTKKYISRRWQPLHVLFLLVEHTHSRFINSKDITRWGIWKRCQVFSPLVFSRPVISLPLFSLPVFPVETFPAWSFPRWFFFPLGFSITFSWPPVFFPSFFSNKEINQTKSNRAKPN